MKNNIFLFFVICSQFLFSQKFSHSLRAESERIIPSAAVKVFPDTLQVLAVLVQFQPDNDSRTSGNGQFDLSNSNERIIDAPPHDSGYFADHFLFAQNYFSKSSNGKQHVKGTVFGNVITLKKQMKDYAPVSGNLPLAQMIEEAWRAADSLNPVFPFQNYDLFVVFHAGAGKDIDLRAALGYDPTPLDIPSLYFNLSSLKTIFGTSYQGVILANSSFKIPNSVILPETEVRKIPSIGGDFVLKLGINGLIVASIGSHLGLPDLFDTKTGKSGIGRFGLMDGQSIFSFSGISPPEPSAWEKIFLGWTTPIDVVGNNALNVPAVGMYSTGNDTIYKIPISAKEYFLVENRHRDVKGDGQTITMRWNGQTIQKTFSRDENFFSNINIDSAYGSVIDVDELDWSLPGLINANNDYKGGILVWHVDETIIDKNLAANTLNAEPEKRGVDLEEADGSQDIGQTYDFGDPASGSEDGTPIDYWFSGNISPLFKNEFSENTNPNSLSNSFARSHITLKNFSVISPRMSFEVNVGSSSVQLLKVIKRNNIKLDNNDAPTTADLDGDGNEELIYTSGDSIYVLKNDLTPYLNNMTGLFSSFGGKFQPIVVKNYGGVSNNPFNGIIGSSDNKISLLNSNNSLLTVSDTVATFTIASTISTPLVYEESNSGRLHFATKNAGYTVLNFDATNKILGSVFQTSLIDTPKILSREPLLTTFYSRSKIFTLTTNTTLNSQIVAGTKVILKGSRTDEIIPLVLNGGFTSTKLNFNPIQFKESFTSSFAVADFEADNNIEILIGTSTGLSCLNENGIIRENFPLKVLDGGRVVGSPTVVKLTGANETAILFGSSNGHLYAYTSKGKMINGFPLQTGGMASSPVLWGNKLVAASIDSSIYIWNVGNMFDTSRVLWGNFLADKYHSNYKENVGTLSQKSSELLPKKFAYNWPNPVYDGSTNIRYFLGKTATVKIKIVNLAGELVDELQGTNFVGLDNEVVWKTTNIQSGIYFAQITASAGGEEVSQIIKIAVVK